MIFKKQDLQDIADGDASDEFEVILNTHTGNTRWSEHHEVIFKYYDKFYSTCYSVGLTERQDESPYEYGPDEIECRQVFPHEETITVYKVTETK